MLEKKTIQSGFARAHESYETEAMAQQSMVQQLMQLWPEKADPSQVQSVLEIGCGSGFLTRELIRRFRPQKAVINDLSPVWESHVTPHFPSANWQFLAADAEETEWRDHYHLIASGACIQWFSDPAGFLESLYGQLHPGGILLISSFGTDNLREIRTLTGQGLDYPEVSDLLSGIQNFTSRQVRENDRIILRFSSPVDILRHLKKTGVNRSHAQFWTPGQLRSFSERYEAFRLDDGSYPLTYHPIYFSIQK